MDQTMLPLTGSNAMNSPRFPPGPGYILTFAPTYGVPSMYETSSPSRSSQRFWRPKYSRPVRGEYADGCQSFAPGSAGQMLRTTLPVVGVFSATYCRRPVFKSTPVDVLVNAYGFA